MVYTVKLKGKFDLKEKDVVELHPWIKPLLGEIKKKGWKYRILNVDAEVLVELNLNKLKLTLNYHPPRIDECEEEGIYEISAELGSEPPAVMKILSIERFDIGISTKHCFCAVEIGSFEKKIKRILDVLWGFEKESPKKLAEAREVYEVAKWLIEEKGFKPADDHVVEDYKKLIDLFEKPYRFTLTLELTVKDENKVPSWEVLKRELCNFFYERGLLAELKRDKGTLLNLFRKPIP